jgi:hypothetical protein
MKAASNITESVPKEKRAEVYGKRAYRIEIVAEAVVAW